MADLLKIPKGVSDFQKIVQNNFYYIDKTSFLKLLSGEEVALFTRPRRFGKTLNMSMIRYFFEMNYDNPSDISKPQELFKNLAISKDTEFCKQHMGQYPVIFLSLKDVYGNNFAEAISKFAAEIRSELIRFSTIFKDNSSLIIEDLQVDIDDCKKDCLAISKGIFVVSPENDCSKITKSLKLLSQVLSIIFKKKPIVIIDEYDVPLEKSRGKYYENMVEFIKQLFSYTFKDNNFLEKGFLTGCLRVSKESIFTGFNNPSVYDCTIEKYSNFFGFTNDEVKQMLEYYGMSNSFDTIKEWYDGYEFGVSEIYNPFSVNSYIENALTSTSEVNPTFAWINASGNDFLSEFINYLPDSELNDFEQLLQDKTINKDVNVALNYGDIDNHKYESMWSMLYVTGYLTKVGKAEGKTFTLKIPNKEVKECFKEKIVNYFDNPPEYKNYSQKLIEAFISKSTLTIKKILNKLLKKYLGLRNVKSNLEYTYHSFMDGLLASSGIDLESEKEAGKGYSDIIFTVNDPKTQKDIVVILELKRAKDKLSAREKCQEAIKQCHDRCYYEDYIDEPSVSHIYLYGITFYDRSCALLCEDVSNQSTD